MSEGAHAQPIGAMHDRRLRARRSANHRIGLIGHAIVYALGSLLVFVVAGKLAGAIVLIAWTIALAMHGFFGVVAPFLRERWVEAEVSQHRDATEAARAVAESRHARALAELSASIAHEIRNPITAAKSLVQQIAEAPAAPENAEYATVAVEELDRVERSISHLLRFAREEARAVTTVPLAEPIESALALLGDRLTAHGVVVKRDLGAGGMVEVDPEQLRRVVANVVGNAIDAMVDAAVSAPSIEIRAGRNLSGSEAWVTIADNGPGMDADTLAKVFKPFFTTKAKGTGLGLSLSRKIVEEHGGTIDMKSAPGRGTELVITLPARAARREPSP